MNFIVVMPELVRHERDSFFGKITPLESCFVHHSFCLVLFKSCTVRVRFSPFIETQIFADLILFKSRFVHCSFCLVPFKSRTVLHSIPEKE